MMNMELNRTFFTGVTSLFFLAALVQLILCIYLIFNGRKVRVILAELAIFLVSLVLMAEVSTEIFSDLTTGRDSGTPWGMVITGSVTLLVYSSLRLIYERNGKRQSLNPGVVRYALDRIAPGVCFADHSGRIIMINRNMVELMTVLMRDYPQMIAEVLGALDDPAPKTGVERLEDSENLYRFPDGNIWKFRLFALSDPELKGYTQILAEDVTDIMNTNERLLENTEELRGTNESLREMYDMLSERIRDQENVNLKMSIHNNMGSSLLALSGIIAGTMEGDEKRQIKILKNAVSYFSNDRPDLPKTMEEVISRAEKINVKVETEGEFPEDPEMRNLIAVAAGECVTNCVRHAGGSELLVSSAAGDETYTVRITNNGRNPERPVVEGGGLSSLRRRAEAAGAAMEIEIKPEFALILHIQRKEPVR